MPEYYKTTNRELETPKASNSPTITADLKKLAEELDNDGEILYGKLSERPSEPKRQIVYVVVGDATESNNGLVFVSNASKEWIEVNGDIRSGQIASSAVTATKLASEAVETAKIKNEAVAAAKLGAGAATGAKLGEGTVRQETGTTQSFLSWGNIAENGTTNGGTGDFASSKIGTGEYLIKWNTEKSTATYSVVATAGWSQYHISIKEIAKGSFKVIVDTGSGTENLPFTFMVLAAS